MGAVIHGADLLSWQGPNEDPCADIRDIFVFAIVEASYVLDAHKDHFCD